jgi:TolB protein
MVNTRLVTRRELLAAAGAGALGMTALGRLALGQAGRVAASGPQVSKDKDVGTSSWTDVIFYISKAHIGAIRPDGSGECYPQFSAPNQVYWGLGYVFPDGRQAVLYSEEPPQNPKAAFGDPDGKAFARTHQWRYDFVTREMREIALPSGAGVIGLLEGDRRFLVLENTNNVARLYSTDLDGGKLEEYYTSPGYAYCSELSSDRRKVTFHITGGPFPVYAICVVTLSDKTHTVIANDPAWLFFGPTWSPDGQWLLYQRCAFRDDPGHDRSDLCISRADGSEHRLLTKGQSHWFAAAMGTPQLKGSGSNLPAWSPDGRHIACTLLLPDSRTAWPYRVGQPDLDHFNRDYHPELARGGTRVCLIDPKTAEIAAITHDDPPTWYVRPAWSPDNTRLAVGRADVGTQPELWVINADGAHSHPLTRGIDGLGADHCRWLQLTAEAAATLWRKSEGGR